MKRTPKIPDIPSIDLPDFKLDVQHFLTKEYPDIGQAVVELPVVGEALNARLQLFIEDKGIAEQKLGQAKGRAYFALKNGDLVRKGLAEKATDAAIAHAVNLDDDVIKWGEQVAVLTGWVERFKNLHKAVQFKLELVRSNEATRRKLAE